MQALRSAGLFEVDFYPRLSKTAGDEAWTDCDSCRRGGLQISQPANSAVGDQAEFAGWNLPGLRKLSNTRF